jgi:hypothetical protein
MAWLQKRRAMKETRNKALEYRLPAVTGILRPVGACSFKESPKATAKDDNDGHVISLLRTREPGDRGDSSYEWRPARELQTLIQFYLRDRFFKSLICVKSFAHQAFVSAGWLVIAKPQSRYLCKINMVWTTRTSLMRGYSWLPGRNSVMYVFGAGRILTQTL